MKVGITYDLRQDYIDEGFSLEETAEFDKESTIDGIDNALKDIGYKTERIGNIKKLVTALAEGKRWDIVFNIAEGMYGLSREAQIPALLDAYDIPYTFSDAFEINYSLHKGVTKALCKEKGINTPNYYVVNCENEIDKVNLNYPLFAKPVAEGTSKGISPSSKIMTKEELKEVCIQLLKTFNQPVLVEEFLPGREVTVGIVGTGSDAKVLGVLEILYTNKAEQEVYSYNNKQNYEDLVFYNVINDKLAQQASQLALKAWTSLGYRDAGRIDIRIDKNGNPSFIEVNPLAGLNPISSDLPILCNKLGISYNDLIKMIMDSAVKRIKNVKECCNFT